MNIKKGDNVLVLAGKDRSKSGKVLKVDKENRKVIVEKIGLITKHVKPQREGQAGEKVKIPMPIDISNVMVICSKCTKPTRIGKKNVDGKNIRFCKKCNSEI